jgi:hypothetical protein
MPQGDGSRGRPNKKGAAEKMTADPFESIDKV